jgi:hypothetical protein
MTFPGTGSKEMDFGLHARIAINYGKKNIIKIIEIKSYSGEKSIVKITKIKYRNVVKNGIKTIEIKRYSGKKSITRIIEIGSYSAAKNTIRITQIKQEQNTLAEERLNVMPRHHGRTKQLSKQSMQKQYGFKTLPANLAT